MSVRVLHLIGGGEIGGAEQHLLTLFANFKDRSVNPYLGCLIPESPFAELMISKGVPTTVFPMRFPLDITSVISIINFCRRHKIGIIHAHGTRANLLGRLTAIFSSVPCISTVHSLPEYDYTSSWKGKLSLKLDNLTLPFSSGIITVSDSIKKSMTGRLGKRADRIPVKTIYNGCPKLDFSSRDELREKFRSKWGITADKIVVGTIGRLHPVKGHRYLISAMKLLARDYPELHVLFIGDGPLNNELRKQLDNSGLTYTMTGYLSSAWRSLPAMDIFVLPSISEGMGIVLLEAAQAEVPLIASRIGGIPEIWEDHLDSLLVSPACPEEIAEACRKILQDMPLRWKITANALHKSSLFTEEEMAKETLSFYASILYSQII